MMAHSASTCQCNSRTPPAVSRISTPAISCGDRQVPRGDLPSPPAALDPLARESEGILERLDGAAVGRGGHTEFGFYFRERQIFGPGIGFVRRVMRCLLLILQRAHSPEQQLSMWRLPKLARA